MYCSLHYCSNYDTAKMDTMSEYDADSYLKNLKIKSNVVGIIAGILISFVVAMIVMGVSIGFVVIYRENDIRSVKDGTSNKILIATSKLQTVITQTFGSLEIFTEAMVHNNYNMSDQYFRELSTRWMLRHNLTSAYEYAYGTNMPIQMTYPYNPKVIGLELSKLQNPQKAADANMTIMYGPEALIEGGIALIGMDPIYYPNGQFFGVSCLLIDLNVILDYVGWKKELDGYKYVFQTERTGLVFANNTPIVDDMITIETEIIREKWLIKVIPNNGWIPRDMVWLEGLAVTVVIIMSMALTVFIVRQIAVGISKKKEAIYLNDKLQLEIRDRFKDFTEQRIVIEKYSETSNDILDLMNIVILKVTDGKIVDYSGDIKKHLGVDEQKIEIRNKPIDSFLVNTTAKKTKVVRHDGIMVDCIVDKKLDEQNNVNVMMIKMSYNVGNDEASTSTGKTPSTRQSENA